MDRSTRALQELLDEECLSRPRLRAANPLEVFEAALGNDVIESWRPGRVFRLVGEVAERGALPEVLAELVAKRLAGIVRRPTRREKCVRLPDHEREPRGACKGRCGCRTEFDTQAVLKLMREGRSI